MAYFFKEFVHCVNHLILSEIYRITSDTTKFSEATFPIMSNFFASLIIRIIHFVFAEHHKCTAKT